MDFILSNYKKLLKVLINEDFFFVKVCDYYMKQEEIINKNGFVLLRQDVDRLPENSLAIAKIQSELGIKSTYYFRIVPPCFDPIVIVQIAGMGHEVGYHYEDVSLTADRLKAVGGRQKDINKKYEVGSREYEEFEKVLVDKAIESFSRNLEKLRKIVPVNTICMHGSPLSQWDSRLLWKYYDYHDFGIIGEPYFDLNMESMLYLTDTGRKWNGGNVSIRDKAEGGGLKAEGKNFYKDWKVKPIPGSLMNMTDKSLEFQSKYNFKSTNDIIRSTERGELPDRIMMTFHPQRWTDKPLPWVKELVWQNVKNVGKYFLVKIRD